MSTTGKPFLITGGAGFIGTNLAHHLLKMGHKVIIIDNLSRSGSRNNIQWLINNHGKGLQVKIIDIREISQLKEALKGVEAVFHFAAQVAVTKSVINPIEDFKINVEGTLNILEILRTIDDPPFLIFTSTNKVYGKLNEIKLIEKSFRYQPSNEKYHSGINEASVLDFQSPYGCSKGSADQYILDYSRTYSLPATVFRMSCIYGPHQFGTEDQGWVAYFLIRVLQNLPLTIYGDGKQVRDILFIDDLINAFLLAFRFRKECCGQAFTIGGGPSNAVSLLEFIDLLKKYCGRIPSISFAPWRNGDQFYYVSDTSKFQNITGWRPSISFEKGIEMLWGWINQNISSDNHQIVKEQTT